MIDDDLLYIGGLDLNPRSYNTTDHYRRGDQTWHDVQLLVRGAVARMTLTYLNTPSGVVSGEREPFEERYGFRTTLSARREGTAFAIAPAPVRSRIDREIKGRAAAFEEMIYLETQFFCGFALADALAEVALEKPGLKLLMILPQRPTSWPSTPQETRREVRRVFLGPVHRQGPQDLWRPLLLRRAGSAPYHGSGRVGGWG